MRHGSHVVTKSKTHLKLRMMENFKEMITLKKSKRKFKKKMQENNNKKGIIRKDLIEEA